MHKTYIDFVQDEKFIEWVLFDSTDAETYWHEFKINHPDLAPHMDEAAMFLKNYKLNDVKMDSELRLALRNRIVQSAEKLSKKRSIMRWSAVAATVAILIGTMILFLPEKSGPEAGMVVGHVLNEKDIILIMNNRQETFSNNLQIEIDKEGKTLINTDDGTHSTYHENTLSTLNRLIIPYGKRSSLKLSDGSVLWLNSGSEIEFPSVFSDDKREIRLHAGEMYIEVATDRRRPFFVNTSDFDIRVYGTRFNVSIYESYPQSVILAQGEISVITRDNTETPVYPNQRATYLGNGNVLKERVKADYYTSWKDGYVNLDETPMKQILEYVERYYNLSFEYGKKQDFQSITCTGKLYLSENIDDVMNSLATLSSTTYENKDGKIYFIN